MVLIDFHSMEKNKSVKTIHCLVKNILFCVQQNKDMHTGLEQLE